MKTHTEKSRGEGRGAGAGRGEQGMAVIIVIALISIILIYITINIRTLHSLGRELKRIDQHQVHRLQAVTAATNALPATNLAPPAAQSPAPDSHRQ